MTEPARDFSNWLSVEQVADRFDLSANAIYRRIRSGAWDGFVTKLGRTLIDPAGLELWLRAGGDRPRPAKPLVPRSAVVDQCAMCSTQAEVDDHCHVCGYVRGRLCRSCNALEAIRRSEPWTRYRSRCATSEREYFGPYRIVGVEEALLMGIECARLLGPSRPTGRPS